MHIEQHIDKCFSWRRFRRMWRIKIIWRGDSGQVLSELTHYKELNEDPRIPGSAHLISIRK